MNGQKSQELGAIVGGFRQLTAEGKILQEDPSLITLMQEVFDGTTAVDVRRHCESISEVG